jgi:hypothetical protein
MRAFPDLVAFGSFSTELGEVKMCLYVYHNIHLGVSGCVWKRDEVDHT